jgi:phosphatidylglycerophosphatase A
MRRLVLWLATGLGSGLCPIAPGTAGTLAAVPLYLLLRPAPLWAYLAVTCIGFGAGIWLCGTAARELGQDDPPSIVWDEVVGFMVTMTAAPAGWAWLILGFLAFRLFDILKPWPISVADRQVSGGLGIMLDDLVAGLYALFIVQAAARFAH